MKILSILKRYPATIISLILLISGITAIFIEGKVYAAGEKSNTPGCKKEYRQCSTYSTPPDTFYCSDVYSYECECTEPSGYMVCPKYIIQICTGEKDVGCDTVPCESSDCDPPVDINCGTCTLYHLIDRDPCTGNYINNCGKCNYSSATIANYLPSY